jgi:hypothetical protein
VISVAPVLEEPAQQEVMLQGIGVIMQGSNARRRLLIERRIVDQLSYGSASRIDLGGDHVDVVGGPLDKVILLPLLLGNPMGMGGAVV